MKYTSATIFLLAATGAFIFTGCSGFGETGNTLESLESGVYLDNMDSTVRPQDDFFHYVNGGWLASNEIPKDKSRDGSFERLREEADADVRKIIDQAAAGDAATGSAQQRIGQLYNSFMDEAEINELGIEPLLADLEKIDAISNDKELIGYFSYANYLGIKTPLAISVFPDFREPESYRLYLFQSGLGLPNSDFYQDDSDKGRTIIEAYKAYMHAMYLNLGYTAEQADAAVVTTWALESELASHHRPPEQNRNYPLWHNLYGPGHGSLPEGVLWEEYISSYQLSQGTVLSVAQPEYIDGFARVFADTPLSVWQDYLKLRLISSSASYLDQELQDLSFDFYSRTLLGTPQMKPRWQRGVSFVNAAVGESVGQIYIEEHFPSVARERMDVLVTNLVSAYRDSIDSLEWMGDATRANAQEKLQKFTPNIGYPEKWKDYSSMHLSDDLFANVRAVNRWDLDYELARLDQPVDKREWSMNPQTVNAYYSAVQNSINFPAAILQAPFFDPHADDAVNYGAIGSVIGHEIGHGFDDSGAQFDGDGRLHNWWTDEDRAAFKDLTAALIEQYDAFEVLPGVHVNGRFTQGENIGDLAGVSIAYQAYMKSLNGKPAPVLDGLSGQQRFFIGFAQAFLGQSREDRSRQMIKTDPHSPVIFRVNGTLSNIDGFHEAFDVQPGDALYRAPEDRIHIW